jgi:hypothetical protein
MDGFGRLHALRGGPGRTAPPQSGSSHRNVTGIAAGPSQLSQHDSLRRLTRRRNGEGHRERNASSGAHFARYLAVPGAHFARGAHFPRDLGATALAPRGPLEGQDFARLEATWSTPSLREFFPDPPTSRHRLKRATKSAVGHAGGPSVMPDVGRRISSSVPLVLGPLVLGLSGLSLHMLCPGTIKPHLLSVQFLRGGPLPRFLLYQL